MKTFLGILLGGLLIFPGTMIVYGLLDVTHFLRGEKLGFQDVSNIIIIILLSILLVRSYSGEKKRSESSGSEDRQNRHD